jgi:hypothetical protein
MYTNLQMIVNVNLLCSTFIGLHSDFTLLYMIISHKNDVCIARV